MHLWRLPALSIHGIQGAFDEPGAKTVIPGRVTGKFSIRLVPHMDASVVEKQVRLLHQPPSWDPLPRSRRLSPRSSWRVACGGSSRGGSRLPGDVAWAAPQHPLPEPLWSCLISLL